MFTFYLDCIIIREIIKKINFFYKIRTETTAAGVDFGLFFSFSIFPIMLLLRFFFIKFFL